jgi:hypothetical protein
MRLTKFVGNDGQYIFPPQTSGSNNFGSVTQNTSRIYQMNGGVDEYGGKPSSQNIGNVKVNVWLIGDENGSVQGKMDEAMGIVGWGRNRLFIEPVPTLSGNRWTWAKVSNIQSDENVRLIPSAYRKVDFNFWVDDPGWRGSKSRPTKMDDGFTMDSSEFYHMDGTLYMDDGHVMDSGLTMGGLNVETILASGESVDVYNWGNRNAFPILFMGAKSPQWRIGLDSYFDSGLILGGGEDVNDIFFEHLVKDRVVDSFRYTSLLRGASAEFVEINSETRHINEHKATGISNGLPKFKPLQGFGYPQIPPGKSTIRLSGSFAGKCYLGVHFQDTWF